MGRKTPKKQERFSEQAVAGRKAAARRKSVAVEDVDLDSEEEDQGLDAFQQHRDKISLHVGDSEDDDGSEEEQALMDVEDASDEDASSGDDDADEEEDVDAEDLLEEAIQRGGRMGLLARQAKQLGQKLKLQQGEEDEEDEEGAGAGAKRGKKAAAGDEEDEDVGALSWGANKRAYYDDGSEEPDDEEAAKEEEKEVRRLQREMAKKTAAADYGLDEDDEDEGGEESEESEEEEEGEEEDTLAAAAKKAAARGGKPAAAAGGIAVETVEKQLDALTADDRAAALLADAPELAALIDDLTAALNDVRHRIGPLITEVRAGKLATKEGLSYLEAKHLLLLQYATHIVFYLMLKAEGRAVKDHPVINRLVEIRAYLEKIRPIDKQLSYQVNKLLRAAAAAQAAEPQANGHAPGAVGALPEDVDEDELAAAPRPDQLVARPGAAAAAAAAAAAGPLAAGGSAAGVYRPPKLNPVTMEDDAERKREAKLSREDRRMLAEARWRAGRSEAIAELAAEVAGAPTELRAALPGLDSMAALRMRQKLEARAEEEEEAFIRVPLSRDQAKALRAQRRAGMSTAALMGDFADEVADLVGAASAEDGGAAGGTRSGLADVFARQKVSQKFGGELSRPALKGGDEDLPRRATLGERRATFDAIAAKRAARMPDEGDDLDGDLGDGGEPDEYDAAPSRRQQKRAETGGKRSLAQLAGEEDEFYQEARQVASERKRARAEAHRAPQLQPPLPDPEVGDRARPISYEIQKNRGLTPHRRKDLKNPRKKHRVKFQKALVRRGGAVQDGAKNRDAGHAAYAGEATGVRAKLSKSRRL